MEAEVSSNESSPSNTSRMTEAEAMASIERTRGQPAELEASADGEGAQLTAEGYFSLRHCDSASLSSFSLDTPSLPRRLHAQEDTDSLVSTGTLVPEAIYLPPAGHRLVTHSDWDALNTQVYWHKHFIHNILHLWLLMCASTSSIFIVVCIFLFMILKVAIDNCHSKIESSFQRWVLQAWRGCGVFGRFQSCEGRWASWRLRRRSWRKNWTRRPTTHTNRWGKKLLEKWTHTHRHTHYNYSCSVKISWQRNSNYTYTCVFVQVTMLQSQVHTSEALLLDLQKSFSQSQNAVQSRLVSDIMLITRFPWSRCWQDHSLLQAELSFSQRKMCNELSRLKGDEVEDEAPDSSLQATLQVPSLVYWFTGFTFPVYLQHRKPKFSKDSLL